MKRSGQRRKEGRTKERGEYYQVISRSFLHLRGAPFILSSREIELIADWEEMGIPLPVVLEGIKRAFEFRKRKTGRRSKVFSLNWCQVFVLEAYKQYRERHVGKTGCRPYGGEGDKGKKILSEIDSYLAASPQIRDLELLFIELRRGLKKGHWDEEFLEKKEEVVEEVLAANATSQERARASAEVTAEYGLRRGEEFDRILRLKLVKELRTKHRVPHISPFYY
ncbi:MAG: hypothetical protein JXB23_07300 [Candidatus Aminicenantes bacterium]|nr:hypothetical protein [Candidatus Aminicenantes bacterium]